jgi:cytosine/adenosine deaminase-related metal-dependent hydrolase
MIENPSLTDHDQKSFEYFKDGLLIIHKGRVHAIGEYAKLKSKLPSTVKPVEYPNQWIAPPNRRRI